LLRGNTGLSNQGVEFIKLLLGSEATAYAPWTAATAAARRAPGRVALAKGEVASADDVSDMLEPCVHGDVAASARSGG
jgi:hypothetical protein